MDLHLVRLRAYGGEVITRVAVREEDDTVLVCTQSEFDGARREHREPRLVGFSRRDVVE